MTLLKPSFLRARLDLPAPPTSRSILTYDLPLERAPLAEGLNAELWKLVLLRARRKCRELLTARTQLVCHSNSNTQHQQFRAREGEGESAGDATIGVTPDTRTEAQIVLECIVEQFVVWAQEEYKQRLFRKINHVKDRLETIHRFRIQLILSLHERFVVNGTTLSATTTSSWLFNSNPDLTYQRAIRDKFPFLDLYEPVLFDTPAILLSGKAGMFDAAAAALNGKTGVMYLTLGYLMFYCGGGFLAAAPDIVVVALRSVVLLELVGEDGTLVSFSYSGDAAEVGVAALAGPVEETGGVGHDGRQALSIHQRERSINIVSAVTNTTGTTGPTGAGVGIDKTLATDSTDTVGSLTNQIVPSAVRSVPPSGRQPSTIRVVDSSGNQDVTLTVTGLTEDYVRRVADLLDLIIKVPFF